MFTSFEEEIQLPEEEVEYSIYQRERCASTGRLHWQGFVRFNTRKRFNTVKALIGSEVHIEYARCVDKAIEYCCKEDTRVASPIEIGTKPARQVKLDVVKDLKGRSCVELVKEHPNLWRSYRQLLTLQEALQSPRREMTEAILLYGETGTGKSRIAATIASFLTPEEVHWQASDLGWFDGYHGQSLVIVDELRTATASTLLRMIDRYPARMPVKGGFCQWKPIFVIFTSNLALMSICQTDLKTHRAILRRITELEVY